GSRCRAGPPPRPWRASTCPRPWARRWPAGCSGGDHRDPGAAAGHGEDLDQLALEVVGRGAGYVDEGEGAGSEGVGGPEVDQPVLAGAAGEQRRVLLAGPLDDDLLAPSDPGLVAQASRALEHGPQPLEPGDGDVVRHELVDPLGGLGAG